MTEFLEFLIAQATPWIQAERTIHRPAGRPFSEAELEALGPFVQGDVLSTVRITSVATISNPPFHRQLEEAGIGVPLDFTRMSGITFIDTVLVSQRAPIPEDDWLPLLFHELVHVLQYRELGLDRFVRNYVEGWAAGGFSYEAIPLERDAYELDAAFRTAGQRSFDASQLVRRRLVSQAAV